MTLCLIARLAAGTAAMTLALALHQPLFAGEPEQETASPPASEEAPTDEAAQTARAAMEARRAAHMEQMQARHDALRERAAAHGIDIPRAPGRPEPPGWMSYEEMQAMMRRQGVDLPPLAPTAARSQGTAETPPGLSLAALGNMSSEEVKRVFDVIGAMTPAQQDACFALSRWQAAVAPSALALQPPLGFPQRRLGPVYGPLPGAPAQPMMAPRQ